MRRSVAFLEWKAEWWRKLATQPDVRIDIQRGLLAYSCRQEAQLLGLADQFVHLWRLPLHDGRFDISWLDEYCSRRKTARASVI